MVKFSTFMPDSIKTISMHFNYLVIEGNIGAGKTSLAKRIAKETGSRLILEQFEENPFLPKFYENPERFAFPLELTFLADRYKQLKTEIAHRDLFMQKTVSDYYFVKSLLFSRKTLKDDEYALYKRLFEIIQQQLPKPDIYVYLHATVDKLISNIKYRGRSYESNITKEYLIDIQNSYFDYMKTQTEIPILVLDISNINFVKNLKDYKMIRKAILEESYPAGITRTIV